MFSVICSSHRVFAQYSEVEFLTLMALMPSALSFQQKNADFWWVRLFLSWKIDIACYAPEIRCFKDVESIFAGFIKLPCSISSQQNPCVRLKPVPLHGSDQNKLSEKDVRIAAAHECVGSPTRGESRMGAFHHGTPGELGRSGPVRDHWSHGNVTPTAWKLDLMRADCRFKLTKATAVRQLVGVKCRFGYI